MNPLESWMVKTYGFPAVLVLAGIALGYVAGETGPGYDRYWMAVGAGALGGLGAAMIVVRALRFDRRIDTYNCNYEGYRCVVEVLVQPGMATRVTDLDFFCPNKGCGSNLSERRCAEGRPARRRTHLSQEPTPKLPYCKRCDAAFESMRKPWADAKDYFKGKVARGEKPGKRIARSTVHPKPTS